MFSFGSEIFLGDGTLTENEFVDGCMSDEAFVKVTQLAATFAFISSFVKVILPIPIFVFFLYLISIHMVLECKSLTDIQCIVCMYIIQTCLCQMIF